MRSAALDRMGRGLAPLLAVGMLGVAVLHAQACGSSQGTESPAVGPERPEPGAAPATTAPARAPAPNVSGSSAAWPEPAEPDGPSEPAPIEPALLPATKSGGFLHLEPRPAPQAPRTPAQRGAPTQSGTTP